MNKKKFKLKKINLETSFSVFLTQLFHVGKKMPTRKFYNQFHVGKNEIRVGNFQKIVFPNIQLKGVVNRLPPFKNLSDHKNRSLMG